MFFYARMQLQLLCCPGNPAAIFPRDAKTRLHVLIFVLLIRVYTYIMGVNLLKRLKKRGETRVLGTFVTLFDFFSRHLQFLYFYISEDEKGSCGIRVGLILINSDIK